MSNPREFYDDLADDYHLSYINWHEAVPRQGKVLNDLIRKCLVDVHAVSVLDCSCGIGTQAIGLALQGFDVTATDLSPKSIERARREASEFGAGIAFAVADMRHVASIVNGTFDVVISCDNSLPHLLSDQDLALAIGNMNAKLCPGGLLVVGIRNYDILVSKRPRFTPPQLVDRLDQRSAVFQLWDWSEDGVSYRLTMFVLRHVAGEWKSTVHETDYRALKRDELNRLVHDAGFSNITWHDERATGHHQPLMTARKPRQEDIRD